MLRSKHRLGQYSQAKRVERIEVIDAIFLHRAVSHPILVVSHEVRPLPQTQLHDFAGNLQALEQEPVHVSHAQLSYLSKVYEVAIVIVSQQVLVLFFLYHSVFIGQGRLHHDYLRVQRNWIKLVNVLLIYVMLQSDVLLDILLYFFTQNPLLKHRRCVHVDLFKNVAQYPI